MAQSAGEQVWMRSRYPLQPRLPTPVHPSTTHHVTKASAPQALHSIESTGHSRTGASEQDGNNLDPGHTRTKEDSSDVHPISSQSSLRSTASRKSYHAATTLSQDEERGMKSEVEHTESPTAGPGRSHTLRRTQRSQRLQGRSSRLDSQVALERPQSVANGGRSDISTKADNNLPASPHTSEPSSPKIGLTTNLATVNENPKWHARGYPLQSHAYGAGQTHPLSPPMTPIQREDPKTTNILDTINLRRQPSTKSQAAESIFEPRSNSSERPTRALSIVDALPSTEPEERKPLAKVERMTERTSPPIFRRPSYPLQTSASTKDFGQPTSASGQHLKAVAAQLTTTQPTSSGGIVLGRSQYSAEATIGRQKGSGSSQAPGQPRTSANGKALRRAKYPLQSPASTRDLQQKPPSATNQLQPKSTTQPEQHQKSSANGTARRRARYPLQSPASIADLSKSLSSNPQSHGSVLQQNSNAAAATAADVSSAPVPKKALRRGGYPLQAPASNANVRAPQPSVHTTEGSTPSAQPHERGESDFISHGIRRAQTFPIRSTLHSSHEQGNEEHTIRGQPPPPYASEEQQRELNERFGRIFLPKNIRAVKDTGKVLRGRTIVICLDGTGDKFDDDNSNIVHIVSALKKDDSNQVTYYQAGIGTYNSGGLSSGFEAALDMAVGSGLGLHVRDAYHFLMHSYKEGDRICIFGFSRGAYTARCLAGMIHKVGLLPPRNIQQIQFAYEFYKDQSEYGWKSSHDFKRAFSIDVNVHFLGCFDSVASVGFIPRQLPLSSTPDNKPRHFRHAMALDERRAKFKICRYQSAKKQGQPVVEQKDGYETDNENGEEEDMREESSLLTSRILSKLTKSNDPGDTPPRYSIDQPYGKESHPNVTEAEYDRLCGHEEDFDTDVKEVWFAGCHADVGGGAVANIERHKLAQIPLRWMIRQTFECNTGIIWKTRFLAEYGLDVHSLWPHYGDLPVPNFSHAPPANWLSKYEKQLPPRALRRAKLVAVERRESCHEQHQRHGSDQSDRHGEPWYHLKDGEEDGWTPEQVEDYYDSMTPMNDQLIQAPTWWILEAFPVHYKMCYKPGEITVVTGPNMGLARLVEDHDALIHWTVAQRAQKLGYKAAARPAKHTEWRVVT